MRLKRYMIARFYRKLRKLHEYIEYVILYRIKKYWHKIFGVAGISFHGTIHYDNVSYQKESCVRKRIIITAIVAVIVTIALMN